MRLLCIFAEYVSTRWYRAPEVLLRTRDYNAPVDLFAVGCIIAELYMLRPLFPGSSESDMIKRVCEIMGSPNQQIWPEGMKQAALLGIRLPTHPKIPLQKLMPRANEDAIDLMDKTMDWSPNKRITCHGALKHAYFQVTDRKRGKESDKGEKSERWDKVSGQVLVPIATNTTKGTMPGDLGSISLSATHQHGKKYHKFGSWLDRDLDSSDDATRKSRARKPRREGFGQSKERSLENPKGLGSHRNFEYDDANAISSRRLPELKKSTHTEQEQELAHRRQPRHVSGINPVPFKMNGHLDAERSARSLGKSKNVSASGSDHHAAYPVLAKDKRDFPFGANRRSLIPTNRLDQRHTNRQYGLPMHSRSVESVEGIYGQGKRFTMLPSIGQHNVSTSFYSSKKIRDYKLDGGGHRNGHENVHPLRNSGHDSLGRRLHA